MSEIYLAGGCYWGVQKYMDNIRGVLSTEVGFANGPTENPTYHQVRYEQTGHAETVKVVYDPDVVPLGALLRLFMKIIDPVSVDQQGEDVGHQYRTGIYWTNPADENTVWVVLAETAEKLHKALAVEAKPLENFYPAHEAHQKYLDKNPQGYCHVPFDLIYW